MITHKPYKTEVIRLIPFVIEIFLAWVLFSSQPGLAQMKAQIPNLSGIRCVGGRAQSLGVNVNNNGGGMASSPQMLAALEQSGVAWTRIAVQWGWTETKPGTYDWQMPDNEIGNAGKAHMNILVDIMDPVPCWSLQTSIKGCKRPQHQLPKKEDLAKFVSAIVSRYKKQVRYWEIWNEPNAEGYIGVPDPDQRLIGYREQILIPGAEAVHNADPSAKVVAPAFAAGALGKGKLGDAIKLVLEGEPSKLVDIVSFHSYSPDSVNQAIEVKNAMGSLGIRQKHLWLTETGVDPNTVGVKPGGDMHYAEQRQADYLRKGVLNILASGNVQKVFWFSLTDSPDGKGGYIQRMHFGLVDVNDHTFKPRLAYTELQQLVRSACH